MGLLAPCFPKDQKWAYCLGKWADCPGRVCRRFYRAIRGKYVKVSWQGTRDDAPNEVSVNKTCGADSLRVASWPCSRPHLGPATRWLSRHRVLDLRLACIKVVQNIYISLCVHGLRQAVYGNPPSTGLGLTSLPCVLLMAAIWSSLLSRVL